MLEIDYKKNLKYFCFKNLKKITNKFNQLIANLNNKIKNLIFI